MNKSFENKDISVNKKRKDGSADDSVRAGKKRKKNNEGHSNNADETVLAPFIGRKFKNGINICYINSVLNGLLALDTYRERLMEGLCQCDLCNFLSNVSNDFAIELRIRASHFNHIFAISGRQEDAAEFLNVLIQVYFLEIFEEDVSL